MICSSQTPQQLHHGSHAAAELRLPKCRCRDVGCRVAMRHIDNGAAQATTTSQLPEQCLHPSVVLEGLRVVVPADSGSSVYEYEVASVCGGSQQTIRTRHKQLCSLTTNVTLQLATRYTAYLYRCKLATHIKT